MSNTVSAAVQTEWDKFKAALADDAAKIEAVAEKFAPVVLAELESFAQKFLPLAAQLVLSFMSDEFSAMSGAEKQSNVVAKLVEGAEGLGTSFTGELRTYAISTAQRAYDELAAAVMGD